jgi:hypothetical protein
MAYTAKWYGLGAKHLARGDVAWHSAGSTLKVMLTTSSYVPNQDTDEFITICNSNESTGTGYTAGGATLAVTAPTYDGGTNVLKLDATDATWNITGTLTCRYAVIYKDTGTASTSPVLGYIDFAADKVPENGAFTIVWNANGVFQLTVS